MSLTPAGRRILLNGQFNRTSLICRLHTGYPGTTGANEVSGGTPAYAAKPCPYNASSAGEAIQLSSAVIFDVPACSVKWASVWQGTEMLFSAPTAGNPQEFSADLVANTIHVPAHGFSSGDIVVFYPDTPPAPLVTGTEYYVVNPTTDDFQVAATAGGVAINITANAGSGCLVSKLVARVYAAQDTHTVNTFPFGLPD